MIMFRKLLVLVFFMALSLAEQSSAAIPTVPALKVGISPFSPFVILSQNQPIGFSIDVWKVLARELEMGYEFVVCTGVADKLQRLK